MADRTLQIGTSASSDGRLFRLPTEQNPVITKTNDFTTLGADAGTGLINGDAQDPTGTPLTAQRSTASVSSDPTIGMMASNNVSDRDFNTAVSTAEARGTTSAATEEQQRQSRAFFNNLEDQGISQDEIMRLTGAQSAEEAQQALRSGEFANEFDRLRGDRAIEKREGELLTEEEQIRKDLSLAFQPQKDAQARAGARASETAFRVQGRAAEGSKSGEQQVQLAERQGVIQEGIAAQQRLEERRAIAEARGASGSEIDAINAQIGAASERRQEAQDELELLQAGLDQEALERAGENDKFNKKMMLDSLKAGFEFDPETGSFMAQEGKTKIDQGISKMLGFASDEFGNEVMGKDGNPMNIKQDGKSIQWGTYTDRYGNNVFFDKSNPTNVMKPGGTQVYTDASGQPSSSQSSNSSGMQSLGSGEPFTRDDGSQGLLGENCVKYARDSVQNLPFGLVNKQDKLNAINSAVEQGFGSKGGGQAQVGDAILTSEGSVGHAAVVLGIDQQTGELILGEANYRSGEVTEGRRIAMDDPSIYGSISSTNQPQMSSVINPEGKAEGVNAGIDTQVQVESGQVPQIEFTRDQENDFETWEKSEKDPSALPEWARNPQGETQFRNEHAAWSNQQEQKDAMEATAGRDLSAVESRNLSDGQTAIKQMAGLGDIITEGRTNPLKGAFSGIPLIGSLADDTRIDNAKLMRASQMVGKFMEGGVLRKEDETKYRKMLPTITDVDTVAQAKMVGVYEMLIEKLNTDMTSYTAAGFNVNDFNPLVKQLEDQKLKFDTASAEALLADI